MGLPEIRPTMWGSLFGSIARWLGANWAGLAGGWALGDIFTPDQPAANGQTPVQDSQGSASFFQKIKSWIKDILGIPGWIASIILIVLAYLVFKSLNRNKK